MQADAIVATRSNALSTLTTLQSLGAVCERKIAMQLHLKWRSLRCACSVLGRPYKQVSPLTLEERHFRPGNPASICFQSHAAEGLRTEKIRATSQLILISRRRHWHGPFRLHMLLPRKQKSFAKPVLVALTGYTTRVEGAKEECDSGRARCYKKLRHICSMPFMLWVLSLHALPHLEHDNDNSLLGCHAAKWNVRGWNSGNLHERYKPTSCRCQGTSSAAFKPVRVALELPARLKFATSKYQRSFLKFWRVSRAHPASEE